MNVTNNDIKGEKLLKVQRDTQKGMNGWFEKKFKYLKYYS